MDSSVSKLYFSPLAEKILMPNLRGKFFSERLERGLIHVIGNLVRFPILGKGEEAAVLLCVQPSANIHHLSHSRESFAKKINDSKFSECFDPNYFPETLSIPLEMNVERGLRAMYVDKQGNVRENLAIIGIYELIRDQEIKDKIKINQNERGAYGIMPSLFGVELSQASGAQKQAMLEVAERFQKFRRKYGHHIDVISFPSSSAQLGEIDFKDFGERVAEYIIS